MAKIILGSWMVRYPLGGNLSWALQYLLGLKDLGHDIYFVESYTYDDSCFDPIQQVMSNDCRYGVKTVSELLKRFGFEKKWCYMEKGGVYHGLSKQQINEIFRTADLFIDSGAHGAWQEESANTTIRVLIDGDPAYTHFKLANNLKLGISLPEYDYYFTNGKSVGTIDNTIPTLGINWKHIYSPVKTALFNTANPGKNAPYTTVMNWQSYMPIIYEGVTYGSKDVEFEKFIDLPQLINTPMEIAVSGKKVPTDLLKQRGWAIKDAQAVTISYNSFCQYLFFSRGEFSVCKNVYVANSTGWFSDKSAAFLASGRPVVLQETGFSKYLPVGTGLFAVSSKEEAAMAIEQIENNYEKHSKASREIAHEYLEAEKVMKQFLNELGI